MSDENSSSPSASLREVLRDLGAVLSATAVMPVAHEVLDDCLDWPSAALVPAYFHPAERSADWAALRDPRLLAVVLNVHNGPGAAPDPAFAAVVAGIEAAGGTVVGYVDTDYGARPITEIETECERYRDWYGVADVFLDQVPTEADALPEYARLAAALRAAAAEFIVFNHGAYPDPGYAAVADLLVTFEGPWQAYRQLGPPPAWTRRLRVGRFCHLVYAVPPEDLDAALDQAGRSSAGVVYLTDGNGANPWGGLPGYFTQELARIDGR